MRSANPKPIRSEGVIMLRLWIGDLCIGVWLEVENDLVVDVLLATSFTDR